MTNTPPRTMQLSPAHWRQLALLNVEQLHQFIASIPPIAESGQSAMTEELIATVDAHLAEQRAFLRAWRVARSPQVVAPDAETKTNGAHEPVKRKGGWPAGKPRKPRAEASQ